MRGLRAPPLWEELMLRSFKKVGKGRRVKGSGCSPEASGKNTGPMKMRGDKAPNTDVSSGTKRERSPRRLS